MNLVPSWHGRSLQAGRWHARLFIAPVLVVVLLGFNYVYWRQEQRALDIRRTQSFERAVDRTLTTLSDRMDAYEMVLRGVKGFFDASDRISHAEFRAYVDALQLRYTRPGLQGLALLERVSPAEAADTLAASASSWATNIGSEAPLSPPPGEDIALTIDTHAPVTHHQPLTAGNLELLALEAATRPATREAMLRARDTGQLALTGPIPDPADGSASLAMYLPLYQPGSDADPSSVADRRAQIHGWVAAPFRAADIVGGLKDQLDPDVAIAILDGPSLVGGSLVYRSEAASDSGLPSRAPLSTAIRSMNVGGRRWTVELNSLPAFDRRFDRGNHHNIAMLGVLLSLLAGWFVSRQSSSHEQALTLARSMTGELRATRDALESTLNAVPDVLIEFGLDGRIHHYRSSREDLPALPAQQFIGKAVGDVLPAAAAAACLAALQEAHARGYSSGQQYALESAGGTRWFELSVARKTQGAPAPGPRRAVDAPFAGEPRFIALSRDVTRRHETEAAMHRLAYYDALTGLPNRRMLLEALRQAIAAGVPAAGSAAQDTAPGAALGAMAAAIGGLFYIDLDNFKQINDARGHTVGDSLLVQVGARLTALAGAGELVARLGGDEFVVMAPRLGANEAQAREAAQTLSVRLRDRLDQPYTLGETLYGSTGSIGVTLFPRSGEGAEDLLREADTAMYQAKRLGHNRVCFFEPAMHAEAQERLALEQDLKQAVADDALEVFVQPQVDGAGRLMGGELLLRWRHPQHGIVSPARFIPVAEESGLILRMGERVIRQACASLAALNARGHALSISVNVSQRQFRQDDFVASVHQALQASGAPASQLILEVTESLLVENWEDAVQRMTELGQLGVRFSIDDFGTGYSSLAYLKKLPLYELKIDKSFVQDAPTDPSDAAIVQAILSMARHLHLRVVAEGVETAAQADFLRAHGCGGLQGYLFGRPEPLSEWMLRLQA